MDVLVGLLCPNLSNTGGERDASLECEEVVPLEELRPTLISPFVPTPAPGAITPFNEGVGTTPLLPLLNFIAPAIEPDEATKDELGLMLPMGLLPLLDALRSRSMIPLPGIRTDERPLDSRTAGGVAMIGGGEVLWSDDGRTRAGEAGAREKSEIGGREGNVGWFGGFERESRPLVEAITASSAIGPRLEAEADERRECARSTRDGGLSALGVLKEGEESSSTACRKALASALSGKLGFNILFPGNLGCLGLVFCDCCD